MRGSWPKGVLNRFGRVLSPDGSSIVPRISVSVCSPQAAGDPAPDRHAAAVDAREPGHRNGPRRDRVAAGERVAAVAGGPDERIVAGAAVGHIEGREGGGVAAYYNHLRSARARPEHSAPADELELAARGGTGGDPHAALVAVELYRAIAGLPTDQREVIALVDIAGLSYKEAAGVLRAPTGTIMSRLYRGRARLADALS